ncbi:uncharacterized protein LOC111006720 isoform X2 [Momordica charantia]|uniref:Uncharacterized protein LOC111006720 isoform X2 n=1 Tax=Momordica charantia TaxID=3673 RepID=A0A6J1BYF5_MOMCH|nr:uncharacterized protein LOC111006720 isoform X2 [Momordica charantia]XP_022134490.1 uncharacterized protein LOC111006720 isoform X2 [Momordica charantia]XP_022134491.1 uncharacterized protein LOC111006720 isoform X2 [Momordica charantia]
MGDFFESTDQLYDSKAKRRRKIAGIDQEELLEPTMLADPDSCFCKFNDLEVHYKVYDPELQGDTLFQTQTTTLTPNPSPTLPVTSSPHQTKKIGLPMILLHGFGASVFSWNWVMKPLADITGSKVLAFDRPAFGLTSRVNYLGHSSPGMKDEKPLNPYSMAFSVLATLYFIGFLGAEKAILIGHSAGSLIAVNSYFQSPQSVAALILVAPAILAPFGAKIREDSPVQENVFDSNAVGNPVIRLFKILSEVAKLIVQSIMQMMKGILEIVDSLYIKLVSAILRSTLIRMLVRLIIDKAGFVAIKNAWYDSARVNEHVLHGYTKPLRTKDWDKALVEFVAAMLTDRASPPLSKRLHEISCPVLIITGDSDRLVPSWNAVRLSQAIPGSHLEVIKHCGHLPHEEKVDEFVSIVQKFLNKTLADSQKP